MKHYAGLDVSVKETSLCIVDEAGRICREMKVVSHPEDLLAVLCDPAWRLERVGLGGWASVAVAVQWIGGSRSPGDLHRNATREGFSQGAAQLARARIPPATRGRASSAATDTYPS